MKTQEIKEIVVAEEKRLMSNHDEFLRRHNEIMSGLDKVAAQSRRGK